MQTLVDTKIKSNPSLGKDDKYEAERKQLEAYHKKRMKELEGGCSAEIDRIQQAFFSLVRNYEAKSTEAGAMGQMVGELTEALNQEAEAHSR